MRSNYFRYIIQRIHDQGYFAKKFVALEYKMYNIGQLVSILKPHKTIPEPFNKHVVFVHRCY